MKEIELRRETKQQFRYCTKLEQNSLSVTCDIIPTKKECCLKALSRSQLALYQSENGLPTMLYNVVFCSFDIITFPKLRELAVLESASI